MGPWDIPMYTPSMVGRLAGLTLGKTRRWLRGYEYDYATSGSIYTVHKSPVVRRSDKADDNYASFLDLIELLFIKKFLDHGISLQNLRKALNEADKLLKGLHHFARQRFFTNGRSIYLQIKDSNQSESLMELLSGGQWVIVPIIKQLAHQIDFDALTGYARKWYPLGQKERIVLDPNISFGRPSLVNRGIPTAVIYDAFLGESENHKRVSSWMNISDQEVESAVKFERQLANAA